MNENDLSGSRANTKRRRDADHDISFKSIPSRPAVNHRELFQNLAATLLAACL